MNLFTKQKQIHRLGELQSCSFQRGKPGVLQSVFDGVDELVVWD